MNIITHGIMGWVVGQRIADNPRDTAILTIASVIPDLDSLGIIIDLANGGEAVWFTKYHHILCHNLLFCIFLLPFAWYFAKKSLKIVTAFFIIFHLHLICDIIGGMGPDGFQWPIPYLIPFSNTMVTWSGQWKINAWPNFVITAFLIIMFLWQSASYKYSPFALISKNFDCKFISVLRKRFNMHETVTETKTDGGS